VVFAEEGGALMAADAVSGKALWSFHANAAWRASPMTYMFDGQEYIAIAAGADIMAFGILE
jgi:alcohol dehydrogenase (cytochrome c)